MNIKAVQIHQLSKKHLRQQINLGGNFPATAKSRPLGEGGLTRSGKTEGVSPRVFPSK